MLPSEKTFRIFFTKLKSINPRKSEKSLAKVIIELINQIDVTI